MKYFEIRKIPYFLKNIQQKQYILKSRDTLDLKLERLNLDKYQSYIKEIDCRRIIHLIKDPKSYEEADKITNFFTENARMKARIKGAYSPVQFWRSNYSKIIKHSVENHRLLEENIPQSLTSNLNLKNKEALYALYESVYELCPETSTFSPVLSKYIYDTYLPKNGGTVFDPFAGWGDRMIGAICCKKVLKYMGVDANYTLQNGYSNIKKTCDTTNKINFIIMDILQYLPSDNDKYDLIFTSPPYFDYEIYTTYDDKMQSIYNRNYEIWLAGFMSYVLNKLIKMTKKGGYMGLHVGNTYTCPTLVQDVEKIMKDVGLFKDHVILISTGKKRPVPILMYKIE